MYGAKPLGTLSKKNPGKKKEGQEVNYRVKDSFGEIRILKNVHDVTISDLGVYKFTDNSGNLIAMYFRPVYVEVL